MPHIAAGTPGGGTPVGALHIAPSGSAQLAWTVPRTFACRGCVLAELPPDKRAALARWLRADGPTTHLQDVDWRRLLGCVFDQWLPEPPVASATYSAEAELARRAVQALTQSSVPLVKRALAIAQEPGAWLLDMCYTELKVRAQLCRASAQYIVVSNGLYAIIRPFLPVSPVDLRAFNDEGVGNLVEAAASTMLLRPAEVGPDWHGLRGLVTLVAQLDPALRAIPEVWARPVMYQWPPVAPTGGTAPLANKRGRALAQCSQRRLVCVTSGPW